MERETSVRPLRTRGHRSRTAALNRDGVAPKTDLNLVEKCEVFVYPTSSTTSVTGRRPVEISLASHMKTGHGQQATNHFPSPSSYWRSRKPSIVNEGNLGAGNHARSQRVSEEELASYISRREAAKLVNIVDVMVFRAPARVEQVK